MPFHVFPPSASEPLTSLGSISGKKESSLANGSTLSRRLRNLGQQHSIGDVGPGYPWVIVFPASYWTCEFGQSTEFTSMNLSFLASKMGAPISTFWWSVRTKGKCSDSY